MTDDRQPPTISIVIPTYQHAREIGACLESIFAQTFTDYEIIVVNDGSTDGTLQALEPYRTRLANLIVQENRGGNAARNRGWRESRGRYLLFCDADIVMRPDFLEKSLFALETHSEASYVYSSFRFGWKVFTMWPFDAGLLKKMNFIHTTSLVRREHFPGFDESIRKFQDWDLWLTMLEAGHVGRWIPEVLFKAIPHKGGISTWVPGIFYRIPWKKFGLHIKSVENYRRAERIIKQKHNL